MPNWDVNTNGDGDGYAGFGWDVGITEFRLNFRRVPLKFGVRNSVLHIRVVDY